MRQAWGVEAAAARVRGEDLSVSVPFFFKPSQQRPGRRVDGRPNDDELNESSLSQQRRRRGPQPLPAPP